MALGQGQRLGGVAAGLVGLAVHQPAGARHERQGPQRGALHDLRPDRPGGGPHVVRASPREGGPDGHGPPEDGDVVALVAGGSGPGGGDELVGPAEVAVLEGREAQEETDPRIGGGPDQLLGARQGGELPASEELDGAGPDQELGGVEVAGEARAPEGLDVVAAGVVPRGRPTVEPAEVVGLPPPQPGERVGPQQLVHAVVLATPIGGGHHRRARREPVQDVAGVVVAGEGDGEIEVQRRGHRRGGEDRVLALAEVGQDLADEVVGHGPVVAGELADEGGRVVAAVQGQAGETQRGDPALGAGDEGRGLVVVESRAPPDGTARPPAAR